MITVGSTFQVIIKRWNDSRKFKMNVECMYVSEQVIRFSITAGKKEMNMEKILIKKTNQWKITKMNFKFEGDDKSIAMAIMHIQNEIENHINPPKQRNWNKL